MTLLGDVSLVNRVNHNSVHVVAIEGLDRADVLAVISNQGQDVCQLSCPMWTGCIHLNAK